MQVSGPVDCFVWNVINKHVKVIPKLGDTCSCRFWMAKTGYSVSLISQSVYSIHSRHILAVHSKNCSAKAGVFANLSLFLSSSSALSLTVSPLVKSAESQEPSVCPDCLCRTARMPKTIIKVDISKKPEDQPVPLHNRWHPHIPPVAKVVPGEIFRVECLDWTGGQIQDNDSSDDVRNVDLTRVHFLSGPISVEGAEAGDLLVVDILDIGPLPDSEWGFTGIFDRQNGGGFLTEHYPNAAKAIWKFEGRSAVSRHIPGVRFTGHIHPGLIGCAPSMELLQKWNQRESKLVSTEPNRVPPLAELPNPKGAFVGSLRGEMAERVALEGARTVPPREHGGNTDIKNLSLGSRLFLPVYVPGANLSMGDIHFSQGDGEITFCGAIEMAGWLDLKVDIIKGGMTQYAVKNPIFNPGTLVPSYSDYLIFEGISVDEKGEQHYLDAHISYRMACLNAIEYLKKFGYTGEQAYLILGAAPVEGRISGIVDIPNACCTLAIPTQIFEFDIKPKVPGKSESPESLGQKFSSK